MQYLCIIYFVDMQVVSAQACVSVDVCGRLRLVISAQVIIIDDVCDGMSSH